MRKKKCRFTFNLDHSTTDIAMLCPFNKHYGCNAVLVYRNVLNFYLKLYISDVVSLFI